MTRVKGYPISSVPASRRREHGAAMIETALALPVVFILIFIAIESANLLSQRSRVTDIMRRTGRQLEVMHIPIPNPLAPLINCPVERVLIDQTVTDRFQGIEGSVFVNVGPSAEMPRDFIRLTYMPPPNAAGDRSLSCLTCGIPINPLTELADYSVEYQFPLLTADAACPGTWEITL